MARAPPSSFILISMIALFVLYVFWTRDHERPMTSLSHTDKFHLNQASDTLNPSAANLQGDAIMSKLGNETLKAELGRAAWKLFHTTMARFPDKPSTEESEALQSYIYLFARLYPCGECAEHFQKILKKYPHKRHLDRALQHGHASFIMKSTSRKGSLSLIAITLEISMIVVVLRMRKSYPPMPRASRRLRQRRSDMSHLRLKERVQHEVDEKG